MLKIERKSDGRVVKAIMHRVADIAGGVTVKTADLGGDALKEGTPLCKGSNGLYDVVRTGVVVDAYEYDHSTPANRTKLNVAKGSNFKTGDTILVEGTENYAKISSIDTNDPAKDVITLTAPAKADIAQHAKLIKATVTAHADAAKEAKVVGAVAGIDVTTFNVAKGHTLEIGDIVASELSKTGSANMTGKEIVDINRGGDAFDVVTIGTANGKALTDGEELTTVNAVDDGATTANIKKFPVAPTVVKQPAAVAIAGSNYTLGVEENLFVDAWLKAVVYEAVAPVVTAEIKAQLSGVIYV